MKTYFPGHLQAMQYAEITSKQQRKEFYVQKENSGGIVYTVVEKPDASGKVLNRYRFGNAIALDAPDIVIETPKPYIPPSFIVREEKVETPKEELKVEEAPEVDESPVTETPIAKRGRKPKTDE